MRNFARYALLAAAAATATVGISAPAFADGYYRHHRHHDGDAAALGLFGLATGVVVGSAIANSQPRYIDPPPPPPAYYPPPARTYYPAQPGYVVEYRPAAESLRPWSQSWYRYCSQRYRSFSPQDGTYIGYDGQAHFCAAN
ncbi:BA14K family protein [Rhizobium halophytocola]|uniref:Lectin-like protein BA14k n=1 Tax=Rhizobium halophytocola TaxID=735519 RepID=A0ABS4E3V6_9HYPH|nr:BA14K family protein [Rhizobium halophytocola]MBP1852630.1 hypothetical protein [Rhizobium halophytocola]